MYEFWLSTEQTGTVVDYHIEFVSRLTHLGRKEESLMVGAFLRGLKEEIKTELKMLGPINLGQAMSWTEKIEAKVAAQSWLGSRSKASSKYYPSHS